MDYSRELEIGKRIAHQAGLLMLKYFDDELDVMRKDDDTLVTIADREVNSLVIGELAKEYDDGIIGEEESTSDYGMGRKWFCDPIDGTKAFTWGVPTAMFSLGLVVDGVPVVGVAYDPFLDRLYEAVVGGGSFCNGKPLSVFPGPLKGNTIGIPSRVELALDGAAYAAALVRLRGEGARLACFSGAVYKACLVARGKFVGYFEKDVNAHDMAAVHVIVEEAGGSITGMNGIPLDYRKPFKGAIVSNGKTHSALVQSVAGWK